MSKEEIFDKYFKPTTVEAKSIVNMGYMAMDEFACQEIVRLLENIQKQPIECYSQKVQGQDKQYFLGISYTTKLIAAIKKQYYNQKQNTNG